MVQVRVDVRVKSAIRELRRIRRKSVPFAIKAATDEVGRHMAGGKGLIQREWNRTFEVRRRTFPGSVIKVRRAFVTAGRVSKPTRVVSIAADELLRDQLRGGVRTPESGRSLYIPEKVRRSRRKLKNTYRADRYIFQKRKRGPGKYVAVLSPRAKIPKRFSLVRPIRVAERILPRVLERALRKEIAKQRARGR